MSRALRGLLVAWSCLWLTAGVPASAAGAHQRPVAEQDRSLVIGRVTTNPRKEFERHKAFGDYLASRLGDLGVAGSGVRFAKDLPEMAALLRAGWVDVIAESVFAAVQLEEEAGAELALRE